MKLSLLKKIFLSLSFITIAFTGCKYEIISEPTVDVNAQKNAADYADFILPPATVTASQGNYRCVELNWTSVENAVQYLIYSADTPFDTYTQIAETSGNETTISISENSGYTKYYAVAAVNYFGTVSSKSIVCAGTTLSIPIITSIDADSEGTGVTVNWWMDNCNSSTYENNIIYNISVYDSKKKLLSDFSKSTSGTARTVYISGLTSTTEYYFQVEAVLKDSDQKTEKSDLTNAETAHRIVPDAPTTFIVSKGNSISDVTLSWIIPEGTWYKETSGNFVLHPVYFKIYRKTLGSTENYSVIKTIGANTTSDWSYTNNADIKFNCEDNTTTDSSLIVSKAAKGTTLSAPYTAYTSLSTLTFKDTTVERGKQYLYYIKAFTDDTSKEMTSDSSRTSDLTGWPISHANLSIISDYTKNEDNKYTKISFGFKSTFNNFGNSYKYIIEQIETDSNDENVISTSTRTFSSLSDLNSASVVFDNPESSEGYYRYSLYICSPTDGSKEKYYEKVSAAGKYIVTADANKVPVIEEFKVKDGYKDKFILSWKYNSAYTYIVHYIPVINGEEGTEVSKTVVFNESIPNDGETATYEDEAVSGDNRIYTLEASTGLSTTVKPNGNTEDVTYSTLGTAKPEFNTYDYDTITVKWPSVQKAGTDYKIYAHYENENTELSTNENTEISSENDIYTCKITKPAGYSNASISGKPIKLTVVSKSSNTADETSAEITVKTLGPALAKPVITAEDDSNIKLTWNTVDGAKGYFVYRVMYNDESCSSLDTNADIYYVNNSNQLSLQNGDGLNAVLTTGTKAYTIKDAYKYTNSATDPYLVHQNKISWGLPFGYVVIPVKDNNDFNTSGIISENAVIIKKGADLIYTNLNIVKGSTYGYGLNLKASKATSNTDVTIKWDKPYGTGIDSDKTPSLLRRKADTSDSWSKIDTVQINQDASSAIISFDANDTSAYEYLICYNYDNKAIHQSFNDFLTSNMDTESSPTEQYNKGYTFSLPASVTASFVEGYKEKFNWETYDFSKRALGPDSYEIQIKNLNKSSEYITVATITPDLTNAESPDYGKTALTTDSLESSTKTHLESSNFKNAVFSPIFDLNNSTCTSGMLQVLRDYKHYYRLKAVRTVTNENDTYEVTAYADSNSAGTKSVAYRNITNQELVRCISVIIADAAYQCGVDPANVVGDYTRTCYGATGSFILKHDNTSNKIKWGTNSGDYTHIFRAGLPGNINNDYTSFITMNIPNKEAKYCASGSALYWLSEQSGIQVTADVPSAISSSYTVSNLTFSAGGRDSSKVALHWNFLAKFGDTTIVNIEENQTQFLTWFPYDIGTAHKDSITNVTTSIPIYQSPWWN